MPVSRFLSFALLAAVVVLVALAATWTSDTAPRPRLDHVERGPLIGAEQLLDDMENERHVFVRHVVEETGLATPGSKAKDFRFDSYGFAGKRLQALFSEQYGATIPTTEERLQAESMAHDNTIRQELIVANFLETVITLRLLKESVDAGRIYLVSFDRKPKVDGWVFATVNTVSVALDEEGNYLPEVKLGSGHERWGKATVMIPFKKSDQYLEIKRYRDALLEHMPKAKRENQRGVVISDNRKGK